MILAVVIQSASVQDRNGGLDVVQKLAEDWRKVVKIFADGGYSGTLGDKIMQRFRIIFEIIKRTEPHTFNVLPKRWIVGRTLAWIDTNRRASKHYYRISDTGVAIVHLSAIRIMLNRF